MSLLQPTVLIVALIFVSVIECKTPDYIQICKYNDPDISMCIFKSVLHLKPTLKVGIPELEVPPLEPLKFPEIQLRDTGKSYLTNVSAWGASAFELKEVKANLNKNKFGFKINIPYLRIEGLYDIDVNILRSIPIKGSGPITGNFTNVDLVGVLKGRRIMDNGVEYLQFDNMKVQIAVGKSYLHLANLFNGDQALSKATNNVINENGDLVLNGILPNLEKIMSMRFTNLANKITKAIPYAELFPK